MAANYDKVAHLQMVQGVIDRMGRNSFALKALAVTLSAGVLAFSGTTVNPTYVLSLAGILPAAAFWLLDARYVRLERLFRELYKAIVGGEKLEPYTMDVAPFKRSVDSTLAIARTCWLVGFYLPILVVLAALAAVLGGVKLTG